jgi:glycosyltransferase involved in cell wall biosynthesis
MALISVITVCFNSASTILATLESVASQRHDAFEHIVVDGGSTDGTLEQIESWTGHPIRLIRGPDRGIYDAMNKGVAAAHGDIIGFLNSDDRYADENALASIARSMADDTTDCTQGDLVFVDAHTRSVLRYWQSSPFSEGRFRFGWLPAHPTLYVRRDAFKRVGPFNLDFKVAADVEWMMRLFSRPAIRCARVPRILVSMNAGGVSNAGSGAFLRANRETWTACRRNGISPAPFVFGKVLRKIPQWLRRAGAPPHGDDARS